MLQRRVTELQTCYRVSFSQSVSQLGHSVEELSVTETCYSVTVFQCVGVACLQYYRTT